MSNEKEYYYQCQEKNCNIPANTIKPCKTGGMKHESERGFCIYSKVCKGVIWKEISKEDYNTRVLDRDPCDGCVGEVHGDCNGQCEEKAIWDSMEEEQCKLSDNIKVILIQYFDGSQYKIRQDKPGWEDLLEKLNRAKGQKFLFEYKQAEQVKFAMKGLVQVQEVVMTEAAYLELPTRVQE